MLPQSPRPRAADDFAVIRSRMEELRRERAWPDDKPRPSIGAKPYAASSQPVADKPRLLPAILRAMRASKA
jgi:hypothetical protein